MQQKHQTTNASSPCTILTGVGPKLAQCLANHGIRTLQDLLFHLPRQYQDRTRITPIASLSPGDYGLVVGRISASHIQYGKRRSLICTLSDDSGSIQLRLFHFSNAQRAQLVNDTHLCCFGEVRTQSRGQMLSLIHPEYHVVDPQTAMPTQSNFTPIYPLAEGLTQPRLRRLIQQTLALLKKEQWLHELLPSSLCQQYHLPTLADALTFVHEPPTTACLTALAAGQHPMQQRLIFEELLAHQVSLQRRRHEIQSQQACALNHPATLTATFTGALPFALTNAQQRVTTEIAEDLEKPYPMLRLVQGDVGSGKTVVAAMALLKAIENGQQSVLMAPTEILAEQHYQNFQRWLAPLGIAMAWLGGKLSTKQRKETLMRIASGDAKLVIGTHALFQKAVSFQKLALVVVDEQHRFGVHQRFLLAQKGQYQQFQPHQLMLTATPIPRTLAMTAYADLDESILDELPPGRTPIKTAALPNTKRATLLARVAQLCQSGRQAYWVCTLIDESDVLECEAAENTAQALQQALPQLQIALVHGRMKADEKEAIMAKFKQGQIHVLVATTVIEVGVDVPNASLMVIENPERLGLSQLHQLRGRVGRGQAESHCILLYQPPLSKTARTRLDILRQSHDGFEIARQDLILRGPGEILGTRQTGLPSLRIADLSRDNALLPKVHRAARELLGASEHSLDALIERWLGLDEQYANV